MRSSDLSQDVALSVGLQVVLQTRAWNHRRIADLGKWLITPMVMGQALLAFDEGVPVGFTTYAMINPDEIGKAISGEEWGVEDWNSGGSFWVMDMVAVPGYGAEFMRHLIAECDDLGIPAFWYREKHGEVRSFTPKERCDG
ncbi:MAG: toxin-activating lysine-acyltransferase [Halioglobus sp.]